MRRFFFWLIAVAVAVGVGSQAVAAEMGKFKYSDFEKPSSCGACHKEIYQEWSQSMMSKSYTHSWDEVEYFRLALPHSKKEPKVAGVKEGCIACHSPLAFLTGDIPPKPVSANTRANEGVSCEVCHNIVGTTEKEPFNFSFKVEAEGDKQGPRKDAESPDHGVVHSEFIQTAEFCATCHDEQSPYGAWVKETYREWKAGPYAKEGVTCQDCHMYRAPAIPAVGGKMRRDMAHHNFHGSHVPSKLAGVIDLALYANKQRISKKGKLVVRAELFNGKAGHMVPSGSSEERMLWLEVWAIDSQGHKFHLPVDKKGFKGEDYTIANSSALAYQAMGEIMEIKGFKGIKRDGNVPDGARIFRRPFFDPKGRMTICQWYTAENNLVDYRIGPRETKVETYTWKLPKNIAKGPLTIKATLYYSQIPSSLGEFMKLPKEEYKAIVVNEATLKVEVR